MISFIAIRFEYFVYFRCLLIVKAEIYRLPGHFSFHLVLVRRLGLGDILFRGKMCNI